MIYEFLIRGDITGNIVGAHALVFDANGNVTPSGLTQLTPDELAQIPAWAISTAQLVELQQVIAALTAENQSLKRRLLPDLDQVVQALRAVGLYQWLADAAQAAPDLLDEIAALSAAAAAGDIPNLTANYAEIVASYPPTGDQLAAWQAVLDAANIPPQILAFVPPGASTGP